MKIIKNYILTEILGNFVISLAILITILLSLKIIKLASLIINKGVSLYQISLVFLSIVPSFLELIIPLSSLLAVMLAFGRLSGDSELIVMRANGISLKQLLTPVLTFAFFTLLLSIIVSWSLKPLGYRILSNTLYNIAKAKTTSGLTEGVFNKLGNITIFAKKIDKDKLSNIIIDNRQNLNAHQIIFAQQGNVLNINKGSKILFNLKNGQIHENNNNTYITTAFAQNKITINALDLFSVSSNGKKFQPKELNIITLEQTKDLLKKEKKKVSAGEQLKIQKKLLQIRIEQAKRFSLAFASFILSLFAMPLGIYHPRTQKSWGVAVSIILALAVFVFYYFLYSIGIALTRNGLLTPYFGLWLPNIAIAIITFYTLKSMNQEKWQNILEAIVTPINKLTKKITE